MYVGASSECYFTWSGLQRVRLPQYLLVSSSSFFYSLWVEPGVLITARKRSEGYVFTGVCLSTWGGDLPQCMLGYYPPPDQAPLGPDTPQTRHPLEQTLPLDQAPLPDQAPPWNRHPPDQAPPLRSACWEIRSTSGRYAPYWNAIFLFRCITYLLFPANWARTVLRGLREVAGQLHGRCWWERHPRHDDAVCFGSFR